MRSDTSTPASELAWEKGGAKPLDHAGPEDRAYDAALAAAFPDIGGIAVIETVAARYPDKIAVDDGTRSLTYRVFLHNVYALCHRILDATKPSDVVVSVCGHTCASTVIIMAVAMSGRILVPIDAGHPIERQKAIFDQSGAALILLPEPAPLPDLYAASGLPVVRVELNEKADAPRPDHRHDPDAPLFVSFTSGSTGRPKGIVSGGRYGGQALRQFIDMFHVNQDDVILGLASLSTGGSRDAFAALGTGAKIRLLDVHGGIAQLVQIIAREQVTILSFVPSALRMILAIDGIEQAFRSLRVLDLHGERILASDIVLFRKKLPPTCHISVTMGSVEAGAVFSWFVEDDKIEGETVPVGYLLPGRQVALLPAAEAGGDESAGQLLVRGAMALGAWQNGRIASGPFLEDHEEPSSRIYSMGDLVRRRPDGLYEYAGRIDRRIKVRGLWADLGEIELAMHGIEGIDEAVAVATAGQEEADSIAVYVKAGGPSRPSQEVIRAAIAAATAEHMVPSRIVYVDEIPRLANFKADLVKLARTAG